MRSARTIVIENRAGAGGNIAAHTCWTSRPTATRCFFGTSGNMATNKVLYRNLKFDPRARFHSDLDRLCLLQRADRSGDEPDQIDPRPDRGGKAPARRAVVRLARRRHRRPSDRRTVQDARRRRTRARALSRPGAGDQRPARRPPRHVVRGGGDRHSGGAVRHGMRGLAATCPQRMPQLPDVPTFAEAGVAGLRHRGAGAGRGACADTAPVVKRLNEAVVAIIDAPKLASRIAGMGLTAKGSTPDAARAMLSAEIARWRQVVDAAKIPPLD